ncbi:MAG: hypothetical protein ACRYHA_23595 [Janthinobacterium lividum]
MHSGESAAVPASGAWIKIGGGHAFVRANGAIAGHVASRPPGRHGYAWQSSGSRGMSDCLRATKRIVEEVVARDRHDRDIYENLNAARIYLEASLWDAK